MSTFKLRIHVLPKESILDPQGKAIQSVLQNNLGFSEVADVRMGRYYDLAITADDIVQALRIAEDISKQFVNPTIEKHQIAEV